MIKLIRTLMYLSIGAANFGEAIIFKNPWASGVFAAAGLFFVVEAAIRAEEE